jgi:4-amino-4-deoxy-L-arabinose transferase-like glycosyltransferase
MAHAVLSAVSCVLIFFVGKRLLDRPSGLVGAVLCAFFPSQIWHGVNLMTEPLFIFLLTLLVLLLLRLKDKPSGLGAICAGAIAGLGVLSRSVLVGFMPIAAGWLVIALPKRRWLALVFLLGFTWAMSPWWVRNWQVFHHFVLTTTDGGHGFLIGNNEKTLTDPRGVYVPERWDFIKDVMPDEVAIQRRFYERGLRFIISHPGTWVRLAFDKLCRFWRLYPHTQFVETRYALIYGISNFAVFPFIVAGLVLSFFALPAQRKDFLLIGLLFFYMTLIHMVYIAVIRYREPLMPFLLCFAGYALVRLSRMLAKNRKTAEALFFA